MPDLRRTIHRRSMPHILVMHAVVQMHLVVLVVDSRLDSAIRLVHTGINIVSDVADGTSAATTVLSAALMTAALMTATVSPTTSAGTSTAAALAGVI